MHKKTDKIKQGIMAEIQSGELNMKPKYIFDLEYLGFLVLAMICFVLAGLGIVYIESWIVRVVQTDGLWGEYGELLWSDFSWVWVAFILVGLFGGLQGYLQIRQHYRQRLVVRWLIVLGLSLFLASFFWLLDRWLLFI